jgi:CheY-like chemotaxis protein
VAADDETRADLVSRLVGVLGRVDSRTDAASALAALRAAATIGNPIQLVIVDDPGGMSPSQLVAAIRDDPRLVSVAVVTVTPPVDPATLLDAVARVLGPQPEYRILVVEDDPVSQMVAVAHLERLGCRVDTAGDGPASLHALGRGAYDLVLMDCELPLLDGYQTTAEIRRREGDGRHTPIVAMTASDSVADRARCLAVGMDDHLAKPVGPAPLAALVRRWLASPVPGSELGAAPADEATLGAGHDPAIVEVFLTEAARSLKQLRQAVESDGFLEAARIAHTLRGSAGTFGALRVSQLGADLEAACRRGDRLEATVLLAGLEAEWAAFGDVVS